MTAPSFNPSAAMLQDDLLTSGLLTRRVVAWVFDAFLIAALASAVWTLIAAFTVLTFGFGAPLFTLITALPILYGWLSLLTPMQASPGQAVMGLMVVRDADFGPPTPLQALIYMFGYWVTMVLGVVWTFVALFTTRHRTLHDMLAGLVVVRRSAFHYYLTSGQMGWNMAGQPGKGHPYA
jgi:uncharacterized RDD family membrane protein YckC